MLVALVGARGVPAAWHAVSRARASLVIRAELLARDREDVARAAALEDSGARIRAKMVALAPKILGSTGPAEAIADLTGRITTLAGSQRVRVQRTAPLDDSLTAAGLRRISVRIGVEGDSKGTLGLLGALAKGPLALTTDDIRIVAPNPTSPNGSAELLQAEITVRGWYQAKERSP